MCQEFRPLMCTTQVGAFGPARVTRRRSWSGSRVRIGRLQRYGYGLGKSAVSSMEGAPYATNALSPASLDRPSQSPMRCWYHTPGTVAYTAAVTSTGAAVDPAATVAHRRIRVPPRFSVTL